MVFIVVLNIKTLSVMATFKKFEEIDAWKKGRELAKAIYEESCRGSLRKILS